MIGAEWWAKRGYVYIVQDCRGRHDSEGKWDPFMPERRDGKDTIDWIANQPWSDGKVGMIGASYGGLVQWAAAVERPAALKCIIPQVSPPDAMRNIPYDHGIFMLLPNLWWSNLISDKVSRMERATQPLPHPEKLLTLPLSKVDDAVLGRNIPFFDEWLKRDGMTKWKGFDYVADLKNVEIPALHISGWWDGDGIGTKTNWAALRQAGRKNQWLIYGPWPHAFNSSPKFGDLDYGSGSVLELDSVYLRWFDTWLKGKSVQWNRTPKVQAFVTGANRWVNLSDWPEGSAEKKLYLAPNGGLAEAPSASGAPATYTYDPRKVILPDLKNQNMMEAGSTIVNLADTRKGGLVYRSAPMSQPLAIGGPISLDLYFSTNVVATDFFAMLVDIDPKGVARVIGQPGKLDVRYLSGLDRPRLIQPDKVYKATVGIWDTAHEFKKGHRLGLLVTSEMFPTYARNLNTGEPLYSGTRIKVAKQTIYQDVKRASVLRFRTLKVR
jgi:putative CocE/NonD family hydrolase